MTVDEGQSTPTPAIAQPLASGLNKETHSNEDCQKGASPVNGRNPQERGSPPQTITDSVLDDMPPNWYMRTVGRAVSRENTRERHRNITQEERLVRACKRHLRKLGAEGWTMPGEEVGTLLFCLLDDPKEVRNRIRPERVPDLEMKVSLLGETGLREEILAQGETALEAIVEEEDPMEAAHSIVMMLM